MKRAALLATLLSLVVCATAQAHRPPLTLATADHYAAKQANYTLANYACDESGVNPDEPCLTSFEVDPCERLSPSSADCDVTYYYVDGTEFDTIITIHSSRHDGVIVRESQPSISD